MKKSNPPSKYKQVLIKETCDASNAAQLLAHIERIKEKGISADRINITNCIFYNFHYDDGTMIGADGEIIFEYFEACINENYEKELEKYNATIKRRKNTKKL